MRKCWPPFWKCRCSTSLTELRYDSHPTQTSSRSPDPGGIALDTNLQDVPREALDASSKESPISHALTRTRRGWKLRRSHFAAYFGAGFVAAGLALYSISCRIGADASIRYGMLAILCGTGLFCWILDVLGRLNGLSVSFDLVDNYVVVFQGRKPIVQYPLHELAAIQACYRYAGSGRAVEDASPRETGVVGKKMETFLVGRYQGGGPLADDDFQVALVRRRQNGACDRQWILSTTCVSQVRKLGERTAKAVGVPFLDRATPEDVSRVRAGFLKSGGRLPRPQRGGGVF